MKTTAANLICVAAGGAIGASLRYWATGLSHALMGKNFPYGTLMVNIAGSLLIGYLLVLLPDSDESMPMLKLLLITGVLGGFTTYSAFSVETLQLVQDGQLSKAGLNVILTLALCFIAVWAGFATAKTIHH